MASCGGRIHTEFTGQQNQAEAKADDALLVECGGLVWGSRTLVEKAWFRSSVVMFPHDLLWAGEKGLWLGPSVVDRAEGRPVP